LDENFKEFLNLERFYSKNFYEYFSSADLSQFRYEIVECEECGLYYLSQVLNDTGMKLLYNTWLDSDLLKLYYSSQPYDRESEIALRCLKRHFKDLPTLKLLDFGAGYGGLCQISHNLGIQTFAFDISADKNTSINSSGTTIIGDLSSFSQQFDIIWLSQVLEHLSSPKLILDQLSASLKVGGIIFIATPDAERLPFILNHKSLSLDLFKLLSPHQHINGFKNSTLIKIGKSSGLRPLSLFEIFKIFRPFEPNQQEFVYYMKRLIKNSRLRTAIFFEKVD
jgi:SAM-dependent methyltransferase